MKLRDHFGIEPLDLRAVGLFRIYLGIVLIIDVLVCKLPNLRQFYGPRGIFEDYYSFLDELGFPFYLNIYHALQHDWLVYVFFAISLLIFLCFTLGIGGKLVAVLCYLFAWMPYMSIEFTLVGEDRLLLFMLFLGLFLPLNARYTVGKGGRRDEGQSVDALTSVCALVAVGVIYIIAGLTKLGGTWGTGEAMRNLTSCFVTYSVFSEWSLDQTWLLIAIEVLGLAFELAVVPLLFFPVFNRYLRVGTVAGLFFIHFGSLPLLFPGYYFVVVTSWLILLIPGVVFDRFSKNPSQQTVDEAKREPTRLLRTLRIAGKVTFVVYVTLLVANHFSDIVKPGSSSMYEAYMTRRDLVQRKVLSNRYGPTPLKLFYPLFGKHVYYMAHPTPDMKFNLLCVGETPDGKQVNLLSKPGADDVLTNSFIWRRPYNYIIGGLVIQPDTLKHFQISDRFLVNVHRRWNRKYPDHLVREAALVAVRFDPESSELKTVMFHAYATSVLP